MENCFSDSFDPKQLGSLTLAFLGDSVYEMFVREQLVRAGSRPPAEFQKMSAGKACCRFQAEAAVRIKPLLSEEEEAVFRRGKNAHPGHFPKNSDQMDYHNATGLEALFGYLYLCGEQARLKELLEIAVTEEAQSKGD